MDKTLKTFHDDDKLDRIDVAKRLNEIIEKRYSDPNILSTIIALDSPWGTGKTTFIEMWQDLNNNEDNKDSNEVKYHIIYHNSWENDDFEEPFLAIFYELVQYIDSENLIPIGQKKVLINSFKKFGGPLLKKFSLMLIKNKLGIDIPEILSDITSATDLDPETFINSLKEDGLNQLEAYKEYLILKESFKDALCNLTFDKPIIFVIDELDRCMPLYAIKLLEVLKHYFETKNVIFIFSVDIEQLSHSIATIYGQNMDSEGYLRRFFDLQISLPKPNYKNYIEFLINSKIDGQFSPSNDTIEDIVTLSFHFNLSIRDIEKFIHNYINVLQYSSIIDLEHETSWVYYLIILKLKFPDKYNMILHNSFNFKAKAKITTPELEEFFTDPTENIRKFVGRMTNDQNRLKFNIWKPSLVGNNSSGYRDYKESVFMDRVKFNSIRKDSDKNITSGQLIERLIELLA